MPSKHNPDSVQASGTQGAKADGEKPSSRAYSSPRILSAEPLEVAAAACDDTTPPPAAFGKTVGPSRCGTLGS